VKPAIKVAFTGAALLAISYFANGQANTSLFGPWWMLVCITTFPAGMIAALIGLFSAVMGDE
jgi:hypothetical protein